MDKVDIVPVEIRSNPKGASVYIDGILNSKKTDFSLWLYPGEYDIRIVQSGYVEIIQTIKVGEENINRFDYNLEKNTGRLSLNLIPENTICKINKVVFEDPKNIEIAPGTYKLELSSDGYESIEKIVIVERGITDIRNYNLRQKMGGMQFSIYPLDAKVIMKDVYGEIYKKWTGINYIKDILIGDYSLECSYPGFENSLININVEDKETDKIDIVLAENNSEEIENEQINDFQKATSGIIMYIVPEDARITLYNDKKKKVGKWKGSQSKNDILPGKYYLSCIAPGYKDSLIQIDILERRTSIINIELNAMDKNSIHNMFNLNGNRALMDFKEKNRSIFYNFGVNEPGMIGTAILGYSHYPVGTGFCLKMGYRQCLKENDMIFEASIGYQQNPNKFWHTQGESLKALTLMVNTLYNFDRIIDFPLCDTYPFIGLCYDYQRYETWATHMIGFQVGWMYKYRLNDKLDFEIILGNPFNYDFSLNISKLFTSQAYANFGLCIKI